MEKINIFSKLFNLIKQPFVRWVIFVVITCLAFFIYLPGLKNITSQYISKSVKDACFVPVLILYIITIFSILWFDGPNFISKIKKKKELTKNYANLKKIEKGMLIGIYNQPGHSLTCPETRIITELLDLGMLKYSEGQFLGYLTDNGMELCYKVTDLTIKLIKKEEKKYRKRRW